jgi:hypothetical protein
MLELFRECEFKRMELIEVKSLFWEQKGEILYNLWKGDMNFRDPQIQIHSSTFLHLYCTDRVIYLSESHDHRWAKTIDGGGPLLSMSSIKLGLLKENDK